MASKDGKSDESSRNLKDPVGKFFRPRRELVPSLFNKYFVDLSAF